MKYKGYAGFTVVELIMAMLIVGIIGAWVMRPTITLTQVREAGAATKIRSDIRYAQSFALSSQKRTRIAFDDTSESYSIYSENSPGSGSWSLITNPLTKANFIVNLAQDGFPGVDITQESFGGSGGGLIFDAAGRPSSDGTITFGGGAVVTVAPNTGMVE